MQKKNLRFLEKSRGKSFPGHSSDPNFENQIGLPK
jgi:hypothetical protein